MVKSKKAFFSILSANYFAQSPQFEQWKNIFRIFLKNPPTMLP